MKLNCPICQSPVDNQPIADLRDPFYKANGGQLYYYYCDECEIVFHTEPMGDDYYQEQYRTDVQGGVKGVIHKAIKLQTLRAENLLPFLEMIKREFNPQTALDMGASAGCMVKALNDLGIHANGIEIDVDYSAYALKTYGYKFKTVEQVRGANVDLITCFQTLEHLLDPVKVLQQLREAVSDKAVFFCEVPNFITSPLSLSYPHRMAYTERSLYNVLTRGWWYPLWIIPYWGVHANYCYPTNLLALCLAVPVSRFECVMQSARLGQDMARKKG